MLIPKVDQPKVMSIRVEIPWASTDQGALPMPLTIRSESPKPKIIKPMKSTVIRSGETSHLFAALQGVGGTVL